MSSAQTNRQPRCFIMSKEADSNPFLNECAVCDWITAISDGAQTHDTTVLTPHQKWFLSQNSPNPGHWNAERLEDYVQFETYVRHFNYRKALPWHRLIPIPLDRPRQRRNNTIGSAAKATVCIENEVLSILFDGVRIKKADAEKVLLAALLATFAEETSNPSWAFKVRNNDRYAVPFPNDHDLTHTIGPIAFSSVCFLEYPKC